MGGRDLERGTHGEDEVQEGLQNLNVNAAPNPTIVEPQQEQQPARKESAAAGLLRRLSTRRHREPSERLEREREREPRGEKPVSHPPSSLAAYGSSETPRKSFSVRRTRDRESSQTRPDTSQGGKSEWLSPQPAGQDGTQEKKRTHGLGRSISVQFERHA